MKNKILASFKYLFMALCASIAIFPIIWVIMSSF